MDIQKMIAELTEERTPRRGRPPKWLRPMAIAESTKLNGSTNGNRHVASAAAGS